MVELLGLGLWEAAEVVQESVDLAEEVEFGLFILVFWQLLEENYDK